MAPGPQDAIRPALSVTPGVVQQALENMLPQDATRPARIVTVFLFTLLVVGFLFCSVSHEAYLTKIKMAQADIRLLKTAVNSFNLDVGRYPTAQEGLAALLSQPSNADGWDGPYLKRDFPKDPWGNSYIYITSGGMSHYEFESYGADGQPGGSGENADIINEGRE